MWRNKALFLLLSLTKLVLLWSSAAAQDCHFQYSGQYNITQQEWEKTLAYFVQEQITSQHQLTGEVNLISSNKQLLDLQFRNWIFQFDNEVHHWALYYNSPHLISTDHFRILHKDYYQPEHLSFLYQYRPADLLLLVSEEVPIKQGLPSRFGYLQWTKGLNLLDWQVAAACYDSGYLWVETSGQKWNYQRNTGAILTMDTQVKLKYPINIAYGSLHRSLVTGTELETKQSQALIVTSLLAGDKFRIRPGYRYIGQDFVWPLTKTSRYTKDRVGFFGDLRYSAKPWQITFDFAALKSVDSTKSYPATELLVEYQPNKNRYYVSRKWQPNQQYTFGFVYQGFNVEWRSNNSQFRLGYTYQNHSLKFASSSLNQYRIEYKYTREPFELHCIHKFDRTEQIRFNYVLFKYGYETRYLQFRYGEPDGGQLIAKFGHVPNLYMGWSWSW